MAYPKKEDSGGLEILQTSSANEDDPLRSLLRHTIRQVVVPQVDHVLDGSVVAFDLSMCLSRVFITSAATMLAESFQARMCRA